MELKDWLLVFSFIFSVIVFSVILLIGFFVPEIAEEPQLSPSVVVIGDNVLDENTNLLSYDNIRFVSKDITYAFNSNCLPGRIEEVNQAFKLLSGETVLDFKRVALNEDININCINNTIRNNQEHHVVGTGGPVSLINTSKYYVISNGGINLYGNEFCESPNYAIHEILHVLGFSHSLNSKSIMYKILSCDQEITDEIIDELSVLYSDFTLPDLMIVETTFSKSGRYLELNTVVLNSGLASADDISITLYGNGRNLIDFNIGSFDIGVAKVINLDEIKVSRKLSEFILVVDDEDLIDEIDELNNVFTFEV